MRAAGPLLAALVLAGCGATPPAVDDPQGEPPTLRLRHQIMVRYGDELQVFEGYMILRGEAFLVKAFAGPGIDLFTVRRDRERHAEEAHVPELGQRLDLEAVGRDIARAYLGGCGAPAGGGAVECAFYGEPLREEYDGRGRLVERSFPEAHGIGLTVGYQGYAERAGRELADRITLEWGGSGNEMVIRLLDARLLEDFDATQLAMP
jgi:hypothetical protein